MKKKLKKDGPVHIRFNENHIREHEVEPNNSIHHKNNCYCQKIRVHRVVHKIKTQCLSRETLPYHRIPMKLDGSSQDNYKASIMGRNLIN